MMFFFFSSRRRHTRSTRDWSSDVCSSDLELHGEVVQYELQAGNTLRIHPGHVAMFEEGVDFNVTTMPGIRNALFGGDGLFLATLTGPGRIWLQSMSLPHLAHAIAHYMPRSGEGGIGGLLTGSWGAGGGRRGGVGCGYG